MTIGTPSNSRPKEPSKRGDVNGWSKSATRRNIAFLRSVDENATECTSDGELLFPIALTLTLKHCPDTFEQWHTLRRSFLKRIERMGLYRCHWVTEWQRRGVPHLHGAFWFPTDNTPQTNQQTVAKVLNHWLEAALEYSPNLSGQHVNPIYDSVGWFKYLAKHAARGVNHYQRSKENIPAGWQKTGRVWGHTGQWELIEPEKQLITDPVYFTLRRLARSWRIADARKSSNPFRIKSARNMLKHSHPELSKLRGVSEWITYEDTLLLLDLARAIRGHDEKII